MLLTFVAALLLGSSRAYEYGADVSTLVSEADWTCLKDNRGVTFAKMRCWREGGHMDSNCAATVRNAQAAGLKTDVMFFPSVHIAANTSVDTFARGVASQGIKFGRVWLDIEPAQWGSCTSNTHYIFDLYHRLREKGFVVGIYANWNAWSAITCNAKLSDPPLLWYPHYEVPPNPSFSDFKPFGSWSKPFVKQYEGTHGNCNVSYDADWTPYVF